MAAFNPRMLILARESRAMTQRALAEKVGVTQAAISRFEADQKRPSDETLNAIVAALRYRPGLFMKEEAVAGLPGTFFRKRKTMGMTTVRTINAAVAIRQLHLRSLLRSVEEVPAIHLPTEAVRHVSPTAAAAELRTSWGIPRGPIGNLVEALENAGIIVVPIYLGPEKVDGLSVWERRLGLPPMMFINASSPMDRVRYTMAHELGHLLLHTGEPIAPENCEAEADEFAAAFLLPAQDIRPHLSGITIDVLAQLKRSWRVSMAALLMRATSLERVTASQKDRLWRTMSAMGYRSREPVELDREEPSIVSELIRMHTDELGYDDDGLAALLDLETAEFRELYLSQPAGRLRLVR